MSETTPSGYTGGGTSDPPTSSGKPTITGAGGGAGTKDLGTPADGTHPQAPAPTERRADRPKAERDGFTEGEST